MFHGQWACHILYSTQPRARTHEKANFKWAGFSLQGIGRQTAKVGWTCIKGGYLDVRLDQFGLAEGMVLFYY